MSKTQKKNTRRNGSRTTRKSDAVSGKAAKAATSKGVKKTDAAKNPAARANSKQAKLITLLQRPAGATIDEMIKATGWQQHSVRGVISGVLKKRLGLAVTSDTDERGRVYRISGGRA